MPGPAADACPAGAIIVEDAGRSRAVTSITAAASSAASVPLRPAGAVQHHAEIRG